MKVNLLVNYGWEWDLAGLVKAACILLKLHVDLIVRWEGHAA